MREIRPVKSVSRTQRKITRTSRGVIIENGNINPFSFARYLQKRKDKRNSRSPSDIRESMRRDLAAREHELGLSGQSFDTAQSYGPQPGGWTLDFQ